MKPKPPSENDLLAALRVYGRATVRRPAGDGWATLEEMAKEESLASKQVVTVPAIKYRMQQAQKRGIRIDMAYGTALDAEGNPKRSCYYRLSKNGKP